LRVVAGCRSGRPVGVRRGGVKLPIFSIWYCPTECIADSVLVLRGEQHPHHLIAVLTILEIYFLPRFHSKVEKPTEGIAYKPDNLTGRAPHSKCGIRATVSGVRIPPSPPRTTSLTGLYLLTLDRGKFRRIFRDFAARVSKPPSGRRRFLPHNELRRAMRLAFCLGGGTAVSRTTAKFSAREPDWKQRRASSAPS
jgi:hypothetical protein